MMCLWPTVMGGVHFVLHAAGWLESALLASYEKFIIDVEALRMFEWILTKGIPSTMRASRWTGSVKSVRRSPPGFRAHDAELPDRLLPAVDLVDGKL